MNIIINCSVFRKSRKERRTLHLTHNAHTPITAKAQGLKRGAQAQVFLGPENTAPIVDPLIPHVVPPPNKLARVARRPAEPHNAHDPRLKALDHARRVKLKGVRHNGKVRIAARKPLEVHKERTKVNHPRADLRVARRTAVYNAKTVHITAAKAAEDIAHARMSLFENLSAETRRFLFFFVCIPVRTAVLLAGVLIIRNTA